MGNVASHSSKMNLKDASLIHSRRKQKNKEIKEFFNLKKFSPNCLLNFKRYQRRISFLKVESAILNLKEEKKDMRAKIVEQIRGNPLVVGTLEEFIDDERCIVTPNNGLEFAVPIMSFVDSSQLRPGSSVLLNYRDSVVVGICNNKTVLNVKVEHNPMETYDIIGGLDDQIREIKESVELPLIQPELFTNMGIEPPKGVLLYGEPGTGKTLLAKAVANATSASFFRINGSELIKKYLGEGPKLVRDIFKNAIDEAPSIIFIDEIDAVGHRRVESGSSGMREIQRTMVELLNQLDGFDKNNNVKVIMATNRIDTLDPALIRPGRIDRKIYFPVPNKIMREKIFSIYLKKMSVSREVDIKKLAESNLSGADIKALCTEAGMNALRKRNMEITMADFENAMFKIKRTEGVPPLLYS